MDKILIYIKDLIMKRILVFLYASTFWITHAMEMPTEQIVAHKSET